MSDLIEREAVLNLIQSNWYGSNAFYLNHIREIPSAIQCRECKHMCISGNAPQDEEDVTNFYLCDYWHRPTDLDGYCHKAADKKNE